MRRLLLVSMVVVFAAGVDAGRQQASLAEADVAAIERLVADYGRTLGTCAPAEYAALFEQPAGFFESVNRGRVRGREKLEALVRSERQCDLPAAERTARPMPPPVLASGDGVVTGNVPLGENGHYEDVYVRTPQGWRFRSRNYIPGPADRMGFTKADFAAIHEAAEDRDQFPDVWVDAPGGRRFRSAGLTIEPLSPRSASVRARLADGQGHYEDVYVKSGDAWTRESRRHVPASDPGDGRP